VKISIVVFQSQSTMVAKLWSLKTHSLCLVKTLRPKTQKR